VSVCAADEAEQTESHEEVGEDTELQEVKGEDEEGRGENCVTEGDATSPCDSSTVAVYGENGPAMIDVEGEAYQQAVATETAAAADEDEVAGGNEEYLTDFIDTRSSLVDVETFNESFVVFVRNNAKDMENTRNRLLFPGDDIICVTLSDVKLRYLT